MNKKEEKSCMTCSNFSCRVPNNEKVGLDINGKPKGSNCVGYTKKLVLKKDNKIKN